ncbi:MAG: metallophosphatase family protein [Clostridiales bacterium]|jgi:putative phosphoesterase|nr:metallophosphatase family protein [Clostridiales bacterium]
MNILIVSDTHRDTAPLKSLLETYKNQITTVIHLGDHASDLLRFQSEYPQFEMHAVGGNCDLGTGEEKEKTLTVSGAKILLLHGDRFGVKLSTNRLVYYAQEKEVSACLYGHTHKQALFEMGPILFMNPGSLTRPNPGERPGYGLLSVSDAGVVKGTLLPS